MAIFKFFDALKKWLVAIFDKSVYVLLLLLYYIHTIFFQKSLPITFFLKFENFIKYRIQDAETIKLKGEDYKTQLERINKQIFN